MQTHPTSSRLSPALPGPLLALLLSAHLGSCGQPEGYVPEPAAIALSDELKSLQSAGDLSGAFLLATQLTELAPRWTEAWVRYSALAGSRRDWARSILGARRALALDPAEVPAAELLAHAGLVLGDLEAAREGISQLRNSAAPSALSSSFAAQLAFEEGRMDPAEELALEAIREDPGQARAQFIAAICAGERGERQLALERHAAALRADPAHLGAREQRAQLLHGLGREDEADKELRLHSLLSEANAGGFGRRPAHERAEVYSRVCLHLPEWEAGWAGHARALLEEGEQVKAARVLERALELHPRSAPLARLLAQLREDS